MGTANQEKQGDQKGRDALIQMAHASNMKKAARAEREVIRFENKEGRQVEKAPAKGVNYDLISRGRGEERHIEVKFESDLRDTEYYNPSKADYTKYFLYVVHWPKGSKHPAALYIVPPALVKQYSEPVKKKRFIEKKHLANFAQTGVEKHDL